MIFRTWETLEDFNASGVDGLFLFVANTWAGFVPLVLFGFFTIIALSTFFSQVRIKGRGHLPSSFAVSGFATTVLAIAGFGLIDGLVDPFTLAVCFVVTVVSVLWLLLSKDNIL